MKAKFSKYLKSVGITTSELKKRVETVYTFCQSICPEEIKDILVEDYIKADGSREHEHLLFFSEKYIVSAPTFKSKNEYYIAPIRKENHKACCKHKGL